MIPLSDTETTIQLIGFYAGGKLYGVNILTVREILRAQKIVPVENAPPFIDGSVRIRGESILVINLVKRFDKAYPDDHTGPPWVLIANFDAQPLGFLVDSVERIFRISENAILPAPDLILSGLKSQYIQGVCNTETGMLLVLDLNRMLGADQLKVLKKTVVAEAAYQ